VDTGLLDRALADKLVVMAPVFLTELLSDPTLDASVAQSLAGLRSLEVHNGSWERAGRLRSGVLAKRRRACLGDVLIAQACVDHHIRLLTRATATSVPSQRLPTSESQPNRRLTDFRAVGSPLNFRACDRRSVMSSSGDYNLK
jgi:predicted nucleic acid-binding protein